MLLFVPLLTPLAMLKEKHCETVVHIISCMVKSQIVSCTMADVFA